MKQNSIFSQIQIKGRHKQQKKKKANERVCVFAFFAQSAAKNMQIGALCVCVCGYVCELSCGLSAMNQSSAVTVSLLHR